MSDDEHMATLQKALKDAQEATEMSVLYDEPPLAQLAKSVRYLTVQCMVLQHRQDACFRELADAQEKLVNVLAAVLGKLTTDVAEIRERLDEKTG